MLRLVKGNLRGIINSNCKRKLGGRPIGRTPDSGSKASSPPNIFFNDLRWASLPKVAYFLFSLVKKSVKNCTKIGQSIWRKPDQTDRVSGWVRGSLRVTLSILLSATPPGYLLLDCGTSFHYDPTYSTLRHGGATMCGSLARSISLFHQHLKLTCKNAGFRVLTCSQ